MSAGECVTSLKIFSLKYSIFISADVIILFYQSENNKKI